MEGIRQVSSDCKACDIVSMKDRCRIGFEQHTYVEVVSFDRL